MTASVNVFNLTASIKIFQKKSIFDFEFKIEFENQIRIHAYESVNTHITSIYVPIRFCIVHVQQIYYIHNIYYIDSTSAYTCSNDYRS